MNFFPLSLFINIMNFYLCLIYDEKLEIFWVDKPLHTILDTLLTGAVLYIAYDIPF